MHSMGFVKLWRGWRDHPALHGKSSRRDAFLWLLETAVWKARPFDINGRTVVLQPGQLCVSRAQLAEVFQWTGSTVDRFLSRLVADGLIERTGEHGRTIITICNFNKYSGSEVESGQPNGQEKEQRPDSHRTAKEERKKDKNISSSQPSIPSRARENAGAAAPLDGRVDESQEEAGRAAEALALVADVAGMSFTSAKRKAALAYIERWLDGWPDCDLAADLAAPIRRFLAENDGPTHSLARFEKTILDRKARAKPAPIAPTSHAVVAQTDEGEQERCFRAALLRSMGEGAYNGWIAPTRLSLNCNSLTVICPGPFHAEHLQNHYMHALRASVRAFGGSGAIEVVIKTEGKP